MKTHKIVQKNKADKGLRFANFLIDTFIFYSCFIIFGFIVGFAAVVLTSDASFIEKLENINPILDRIVTALIMVLYFFGIETLTKGRSVGKFITGTKVVTLEGTLPTSNVFFKRSLCRIIPFEAFSFLGENGWHDSIPKTAVVIKKHFDYEMELSKNVDAIGTETE